MALSESTRRQNWQLWLRTANFSVEPTCTSGRRAFPLMSRSHSSRTSWYHSPLFIAAFLCLVTAFAYQHAADCEFINFDDQTYIAGNEHVQGGLTSENVGWAFTATLSANWHPLTWLSLQADAEISRNKPSNPAGYHLTNLLLHITNAVLLFF